MFVNKMKMDGRHQIAEACTLKKKWEVGVKLQVNSTAIGVEAPSASDATRILNTLTQFKHHKLAHATRNHTGEPSPMAYLIERKSQTIFVTATSIVSKGKPREMIVESRPEYAVVQLAGVQEQFPVPWEEVYAAAKKRHEANLRLERKALKKRRRSTQSKR